MHTCPVLLSGAGYSEWKTLMHVTIPLFRGCLKIKSYRYLRTRERDGEVPVWKVGGLYLIYRRAQGS